LISDGAAADGTNAQKGTLRAVLKLLGGQEVRPEERRQIPNVDRIRQATPEDVVLLLVSTHGFTDRGSFYFVPQDAGKSRGGATRHVDRDLLAHAVSSDELAEWWRPIDAGEQVVILDTCMSAAAVEGPGGFKPGPFGDRGLGQLAYEKGIKILVATSKTADEDDALRQGFLTYSLVRDGLMSGYADRAPKDGQITLDEWLAYAVDDVPKLHDRGSEQKTVKLAGAGEEADVQQPTLFDFNKRRSNLVISRGVGGAREVPQSVSARKP
jgi:hypothetical protein